MRDGMEESKMQSREVRLLRGAVDLWPEEMLRASSGRGRRPVLGHQVNTKKDQEDAQDEKDANEKREGTRG